MDAISQEISERLTRREAEIKRKETERQETINAIIKKVCEIGQMTQENVLSSANSPDLAEIRYMIIYQLSVHTDLSKDEMGSLLNRNSKYASRAILRVRDEIQNSRWYCRKWEAVL